jgi:hypothetical protein
MLCSAIVGVMGMFQQLPHSLSFLGRKTKRQSAGITSSLPTIRELAKQNGVLFVEAGRLPKLGIAVEVVLYPKLRSRLLQECIDRCSSRACLFWIELEGRHTVQGALFWVVVEIA